MQIIHADWSTDPKKRWQVLAFQQGDAFRISAPSPVGKLDDFVNTLKRPATIAGFDFPIGLPLEFASRARITSFPDALMNFGNGRWTGFFDVATVPSEISLHRPFYPRSCAEKGAARREHLIQGLGVASMDSLIRRCEVARKDRNAACSLFWTLGGNQVGKAAVSGWRDVLIPLLATHRSKTRIWPFDGKFDQLTSTGQTTIVETYPADACIQLGLPAPGRGWSKRQQGGRQLHAKQLLRWVENTPVQVDKSLTDLIRNGFGSLSSGEDQFDATVGLFAMLDVILCRKPSAEPDDQHVRTVEGWILGQRVI